MSTQLENRPIKPLPSQEKLRDLFDYDPSTGLLTWKKSPSARVRIGSAAGTVVTGGYRKIYIDWKPYLAHRLIWMYVYGKEPNCHIDHIDGNPANNRIENLRDVSIRQNQENRVKAQKNNQSGLLGVQYLPQFPRWTASIKHKGKSHYLGCFKSATEAHEAYLTAKRKLHSGCTI